MTWQERLAILDAGLIGLLISVIAIYLNVITYRHSSKGSR